MVVNNGITRLERALGLPVLEVLLEYSAICIILAEAPSGKIIYINDAVRKFRGETDLQLEGILLEDYALLWKELYPDGTPMKREEMPLARAILKGEIISNEEVLVELDNGERRWALASATPIKDKAGIIIAGIVSWFDITDYKENRIALKKAEDEIKTLRKLLPICSNCKKIRDDNGCWEQIESYINEHFAAEFSHGICPECVRKLYPDFNPD